MSLLPLNTYVVIATAALLMACQPSSAPTTNIAKEHPVELPAELKSTELNWARAALERNPNLKVLGVDTKNNAIRVQIRSTGESFSVMPGELAAIPISDLVASMTQPTTNTPSVDKPETATQASTQTPHAPTVSNAAPPIEAPSNTAAPNAYTVKREAGRVHVTGPGVEIESRPTSTTTAAATKPSAMDEPIICEGHRMMLLDNRKLHVDGDAITVRGGCELHLTNSTVDASGVGIVVVDGSIHIASSKIQGQAASLDVSARAKAYILNSNFIGISRRDPAAELQDIGGNRWQTSQ